MGGNDRVNGGSKLALPSISPVRHKSESVAMLMKMCLREHHDFSRPERPCVASGRICHSDPCDESTIQTHLSLTFHLHPLISAHSTITITNKPPNHFLSFPSRLSHPFLLFSKSSHFSHSFQLLGLCTTHIHLPSPECTAHSSSARSALLLPSQWHKSLPTLPT